MSKLERKRPNTKYLLFLVHYFNSYQSYKNIAKEISIFSVSLVIDLLH